MASRPRTRCGRRPIGRERQRGAVAIIVGLMLVVILGFIGLAIDGGHLYLSKTELQNASDACALAASYELAGAPAIPAAAFPRAEAAGRTIAKQNKVDFQGSQITDADITVTFGTTLAAGGTWTSAGAASPGSILVVVAYHKVNQYAAQSAANSQLDPTLGLWLPLLALAGMILWMYHVLADKPGGQPIGALEWFFAAVGKRIRGLMPKLRDQPADEGAVAA